MNWKNLFSKQILARGYQYYLSDAVRDYDNQNNILTAEEVTEGMFRWFTAQSEKSITSAEWKMSIESNCGN